MTKRKYKITKTTAQFIEGATEVHGNGFSYEKSVYINSQTEVEIICKKHGSFWQTPNSHVSGRSICYDCSHESRFSNTIIFIGRSNIIHNFKFNYDLVEYRHSKKKVKIICPIHGIFEQIPNDHLQGKGCKECAKRCQAGTKEIFI